MSDADVSSTVDGSQQSRWYGHCSAMVHRHAGNCLGTASESEDDPFRRPGIGGIPKTQPAGIVQPEQGGRQGGRDWFGNVVAPASVSFESDPSGVEDGEFVAQAPKEGVGGE